MSGTEGLGRTAISKKEIRFGTSGWRGRLGEEVTFARARRLARAVGIHWQRAGTARRVLVGFDTRLASEALAHCLVDVLHESGFQPILTHAPLPTPVLTHAVRRRRVAGGLMLTASHNPPLDHGVKIFGPNGGALSDDEARQLEVILERCDGRESSQACRIRRVDLLGAYIRRVGSLLDKACIERARVRTVYDAMHGTGANLLPHLFDSIGVRAHLLNMNADPSFGGRAPDPVRAHLGDLMLGVEKERSRKVFGLATDGDGDRLTVILRGGRILSETEMAALLVDHLAQTGRLRGGGVAVTRASGSLIDRVAAGHNLELIRTPIGFKFLAPLLESKRAVVAADESGGFAWSRMGLDKDGLLAAALFCEMASMSPGGVQGRLKNLQDHYGPSACGRRAVLHTDTVESAFRRLQGTPPNRFDRAKVRQVQRDDGLRLELDDGFVMWRGSGTEPVVRVYAEARTTRDLAHRLTLAERALGVRSRTR